MPGGIGAPIGSGVNTTLTRGAQAYEQAVTANVTLAMSQAVSAGKGVAADVSAATVQGAKSVSRGVSAVFEAAASVAKAVTLDTIGFAMTAGASVVKNPGKPVSTSLSASATQGAKTVGKLVTALVDLAYTDTKAIAFAVSAAVSAAATTLKAVMLDTINISVALGMASSVTKAVAHTLQQAFVSVDNRYFSHVITDTVNFLKKPINAILAKEGERKFMDKFFRTADIPEKHDTRDTSVSSGGVRRISKTKPTFKSRTTKTPWKD